MGAVSDRLFAMQSSGNKVITLVSDTRSNEDCCMYFTKILRWVNLKYGRIFSRMNNVMAISYASKLVSSGKILEDFKSSNNTKVTEELLVTLQECAMWSARFNASGDKKQMRWAYIAAAGDIDENKKLDIIGTPKYNCMILADYPTEFRRYLIKVSGVKRSLDIITRSEEDYDVVLWSSKSEMEEEQLDRTGA